MVFASYGRGIGRVVRYFGLVIITYLTGLFAAAALTYPVYRIMRSQFAMTGIAADYFTEFPFQWLNTWFFHNASAVDGYQYALIGAGVTFVVFNVLLLGGILETLIWTEEGFSLSRFASGIGRYALQFLFIFVVSSALYFAVLKYGNHYLESGLDRIYARWPGEWVDLGLTWGRWLIIGGVLAGLNALFDYTRIIYVLGRTRWIIVAFFKAIGFMLGHIWKTFWLYYLLAFTALLIIAGYLYAISRIEINTLQSAAIAFGIQQIYMIARTWIRLSFYSGQSILYEKLVPLEEGEEEKTDESEEDIRPDIDLE